MDKLTKCDGCSQDFNHGAQTPKILPKCGHTLCLKCVKDLLLNSSGSNLITCSVCD